MCVMAGMSLTRAREGCLEVGWHRWCRSERIYPLRRFILGHGGEKGETFMGYLLCAWHSCRYSAHFFFLKPHLKSEVWVVIPLFSI